MYRLANCGGDAVLVPQLLFTKLAVPTVKEPWFRVALYVVSSGGADAEQIAAALGISRAQVENALTYWMGAGLIEREARPEAPLPEKRKPLTTRETAEAGHSDPVLGMMLQELQRIFGRVLGEGQLNHFATLYVKDRFPAEMVLMAATYSASRGAVRAAYVEQVLMDWRRQGVNDSAAADALLRAYAEREEREQALADAMGLEWDPFTLADKKKIAQWYEEYGYGPEMIEAARLAAGERQNEVKYLHGILKKWYGKGFAGVKDVRQSGDTMNMRVQSSRGRVAPEQDVMLKVAEYVPLKQRREE